MVGGSGVGAAQVGEVLAALILVIVAIVAASWLMRRVSGVNMRSNVAIRVLAALPLGQRERVILVEVGQTQLLLGVSANGINRLHEFDPLLELGGSAAGPELEIDFATRLRQSLSRGVSSS